MWYHPLSHVSVELLARHLEIAHMVSRGLHPISQLLILFSGPTNVAGLWRRKGLSS